MMKILCILKEARILDENNYALKDIHISHRTGVLNTLRNYSSITRASLWN
ncbi:hypothetical protein AAZX31_05G158700 [Glycine max]